MATTSQQSDFDRVKRWGKEFLAAGQAATDGTGQMAAGKTRFNPPPGWPPAPAGWVAPPGWLPDPSWPDPPPRWQLWVEDRPAISPRAQDALLAMAGGIGMWRQSGRFTTARTDSNTRVGEERTFWGGHAHAPPDPVRGPAPGMSCRGASQPRHQAGPARGPVVARLRRYLQCLGSDLGRPHIPYRHPNQRAA